MEVFQRKTRPIKKANTSVLKSMGANIFSDDIFSNNFIDPFDQKNSTCARRHGTDDFIAKQE